MSVVEAAAVGHQIGDLVYDMRMSLLSVGLCRVNVALIGAVVCVMTVCSGDRI